MNQRDLFLHIDNSGDKTMFCMKFNFQNVKPLQKLNLS